MKGLDDGTVDEGLRCRVVRRIKAMDGLREDVEVASFQAVLLDTLEPPPHGVAAVVTSTTAFAQQVGDQA